MVTIGNPSIYTLHFAGGSTIVGDHWLPLVTIGYPSICEWKGKPLCHFCTLQVGALPVLVGNDRVYTRCGCWLATNIHTNYILYHHLPELVMGRSRMVTLLFATLLFALCMYFVLYRCDHIATLSHSMILCGGTCNGLPYLPIAPSYFACSTTLFGQNKLLPHISSEKYMILSQKSCYAMSNIFPRESL